ncbi:15104_t:CDS:2, partial [Cetraspora pellucida]
MPSHEVFEEVSSQETFKGERTFERETFIESMPQDMYMDLENLNNVMSSQETFKGEPIFER